MRCWLEMRAICVGGSGTQDAPYVVHDFEIRTIHFFPMIMRYATFHRNIDKPHPIAIGLRV